MLALLPSLSKGFFRCRCGLRALVCVYFHFKPLVYSQGFFYLRHIYTGLLWGMRHEALLQGNCVTSVYYSIRSVVYSGGTLVDQSPRGGYSGVHIGGHIYALIGSLHNRKHGCALVSLFGVGPSVSLCFHLRYGVC